MRVSFFSREGFYFATPTAAAAAAAAAAVLGKEPNFPHGPIAKDWRGKGTERSNEAASTHARVLDVKTRERDGGHQESGPAGARFRQDGDRT